METHLFILWENSLHKKTEILHDIENHFEILGQYYITWSKEKFSENLSRFYGTTMPANSEKEAHIGNGEFLLIVIKDSKPKYETRLTNRGLCQVNINMFDKKMEYRTLVGGGHKVHSTDNESETDHDLTLLIGKNASDFCKNIPASGKINCDMTGANGFASIEELFYVLNNCSNYLILRNFESLPEEIYVNEHNDIDILCDNPLDCALILNAKKVFPEYYRVHYVTTIKHQGKEKEVYFDLRFVGDEYYDKNLEIELLQTRTMSKKGFYTINKKYYLPTLLYHAYIHKTELSKDYQLRLKTMDKSLNSESSYIKYLESWLNKNDYKITIPIDKSVCWNKDNVYKFDNCLYPKNTLTTHFLEDNEKIFTLETQINVLSEEKTQLHHELNKLVNSKSWKITKPLRWIVEKFKK